MLRVRAITPIHVAAEELQRRQERYDRLAPAGVSIHLEDLGDSDDVPRALDDAIDIEASERRMVDVMAGTDPNRFDIVMPDCVLDPGVGVDTEVATPVVGISALSAHLLASLGRSFAAVARNEAIGTELRRKLTSYGLADVLHEIHILNLSLEDIPDDVIWAEKIKQVVTGTGIDAVYNGCSAVEVQPGGPGPYIVDPTAAALAVLGAAHHLGLLPTSLRGGA